MQTGICFSSLQILSKVRTALKRKHLLADILFPLRVTPPLRRTVNIFMSFTSLESVSILLNA